MSARLLHPPAAGPDAPVSNPGVPSCPGDRLLRVLHHFRGLSLPLAIPSAADLAVVLVLGLFR